MKGLVYELQRKTIDRNISVSELLRLTLLVAKKLKQTDLLVWLNNEMTGYRGDAIIPDYRKVPGQIMIENPIFGWQPIVFESLTEAELVSTKPVGHSIGELENLQSSKYEGAVLSLSLPKGIELRLMKTLGVNTPPTFIANDSVVFGILDTVRNIILNWTFKLEEKNVLGTDMAFSIEEKENASSVIFNIGEMHNSQIQQNTTNSTQSIQISNETISEIKRVLSELKEIKDKVNLESEETKEYDADIQTIEAQVTSSKPKRGIIKESLLSIKRILEGAAGAVIAKEIIDKIPLIVNML